MRVGGYGCGLVGVSLPLFFPSLCSSRWLLLVDFMYTFRQLVGSFVLVSIYPVFYPSKNIYISWLLISWEDSLEW